MFLINYHEVCITFVGQIEQVFAEIEIFNKLLILFQIASTLLIDSARLRDEWPYQNG